MPPGTRIYAIGDIHGRADLLRRLHERIEADLATSMPDRAVIVYLGDYVDRGPDSRAVIECLIEQPLSGAQSVHLKGNHEDLMLRALDGRSDHATRLWLMNGGGATLRSYGIVPGAAPAPFDPLEPEFLDFEPDDMMRLAAELPFEHRSFLESLALFHTEGGYLFVHAGIRPGIALAEQRTEDLMWIRRPFLESDADFGIIVVHGHSIRPDPDVRPNRIGIDTGAFRSGRLCCLVLERDERRFLFT